MKKFFTLLLLVTVIVNVKAQSTSPATPVVMPYGKINMADLEMKSCDFEKDANAEILFDKASVISSNNLVLERHVRIKIFNDVGKNQANIRLPYFYRGFDAGITDIKAETINLNHGEIEFTPLEKKQTITEKIDRQQSALVFSMPNVKAGSVIEFKYSLFIASFPVWTFQNTIPSRYSEIETFFGPRRGLKVISHVREPYTVNIGSADDPRQIRALSNVHSITDEPFMGGRFDNLQRIEYIGLGTITYTWPIIAKLLRNYSEVGGQFDRSLTGEEEIIKQAKNLKSTDEKIAFVFDQVKNNMTWNNVTHFYTIDGTVRAWDNKTGSSAEINMIVYRLLKKSGIKAYPMIVSTKNNGKLNPSDPDMVHLNNILTYIPIDSTKCYVLDATNKFNLFNVIPIDNLNTYGLCLDDSENEYKLVLLEDKEPVMQSVFLNADVKSDGKMSGDVEINSSGYNKIEAIKKYKTDGEKKYINYLQGGGDNLDISSFKLKDMEVDSLPLTVKANFNMNLSGADDNYIYFKTNLFALTGTNPFLSESRFSDINFGYLDNYSINNIYKLPAGYKTDALLKNVTIIMPDRSIIFKRIVAEDNGTLVVRFALTHKKTYYFSDEYQDLRGFYKKMYEMLNEQIVLKKS